MKRATTSLPVPDSPCRNTVVSVTATCAAFVSTRRHSGDWPITRDAPACRSLVAITSRTRLSRRSACTRASTPSESIATTAYAISMPSPLILFALHPFANIGSAVLKLHAVSFATHEKSYCLSIDQADVFQIDNDVTVACLELEQSPQLGYRLCVDAATDDEDTESPSRRHLNPKGHGLAAPPRSLVAACWAACRLSDHRLRALQTNANWISVKNTGRKRNPVT